MTGRLGDGGTWRRGDRSQETGVRRLEPFSPDGDLGAGFLH